MAVQIQPDYPQAENNLALALLADGQWDDAEALLERIPGFAQAWNNLGEIQRERRLFDEAIESYLRATAIDPHCNLAQLLLERDEFDAARRHCETALRL
jgi:tetratricopeptide (TPR) repeat protein